MLSTNFLKINKQVQTAAVKIEGKKRERKRERENRQSNRVREQDRKPKNLPFFFIQ